MTEKPEYAESLKMLESEEGQLNAVFACFGSAAQRGQYFEQSLTDFLLTYNQIAHTSLSIVDLEELEEKLQRKTMGALLREFDKYVKINDEGIADCLSAALQQRNFLAHHYFLQREDKLSSMVGRMEMLKELVEIDQLLTTACNLTGGMRVAFSDSLKGSQIPIISEDVLFSIEVDLPDTDTPAS